MMISTDNTSMILELIEDYNLESEANRLGYSFKYLEDSRQTDGKDYIFIRVEPSGDDRFKPSIFTIDEGGFGSGDVEWGVQTTSYGTLYGVELEMFLDYILDAKEMVTLLNKFTQEVKKLVPRGSVYA